MRYNYEYDLNVLNNESQASSRLDRSLQAFCTPSPFLAPGPQSPRSRTAYRGLRALLPSGPVGGGGWVASSYLKSSLTSAADRTCHRRGSGTRQNSPSTITANRAASAKVRRGARGNIDPVRSCLRSEYPLVPAPPAPSSCAAQLVLDFRLRSLSQEPVELHDHGLRMTPAGRPEVRADHAPVQQLADPRREIKMLVQASEGPIRSARHACGWPVR